MTLAHSLSISCYSCAMSCRKKGSSQKNTKEICKDVLLLYAQWCIIVSEQKKGGMHMAVKSANLYARIEPELKEEAESILAALGIPASNAITMFYRQIILQRGMPFEVKLPAPKIPMLHDMTEEDLNRELEKGYADMVAGHARDASEAFDNIRQSRA